MKVSKYTLLFDVDAQEYYAYNTISNALIEIDKDSYDKLKFAQNNRQIASSLFDKELLDVLVSNTILSENDTDDYLRYKSYIMKLRAEQETMHLTLAPTMDCCFRCHYCFEQYKEKGYMNPAVMDAIIKFVMSIPKLKLVKLTWFGGEPLMAVSQMEEFYDKFTEVWKKPLFSDIITTGYHLNAEVIRVLKKIGIRTIQITLDGMKETHNKVKFLPSGEDVFEKILSNIELLNNLAPNIGIIIRVNLTKDNANDYEKLFQLYLERFKGRTNISIAPAFVLDRGGNNCDSCLHSSMLFNQKEKAEFILDLAHKNVDSPYIRYPKPFFVECAIRNNMAISVDPNGYVYKCWESIGNKKYAIGKLSENGTLIEVNEIMLNRQLYGADTLDNPTCVQCIYLPLCNGGCPIQRIENEFEGRHNPLCVLYKGHMEDFLKVHLARKKAGIDNY